MTQKSGQYRFNTSSTNMSEGTIRMEEVRLMQIIGQHFLSLASRTHRLQVSDEAPGVEGQRIRENIGMVKTFAVLPRGTTRDMPHWLIELHFIEPLSPMGIEVADAFTVGVLRYGEKRPDLDLRTHMAEQMGVSRCHIRLEPHHATLNITDLDSTNGTWINGIRIPSNRPIALQDEDVISLAGLSFVIHIVSTPSDLGI
jgi:hypothetical protein